MTEENHCPKCHNARLKSWAELSEDERDVANRLAASMQYSAAERERMNRWCTRCWYESDHSSQSHNA